MIGRPASALPDEFLQAMRLTPQRAQAGSDTLADQLQRSVVMPFPDPRRFAANPQQMLQLDQLLGVDNPALGPPPGMMPPPNPMRVNDPMREAPPNPGQDGGADLPLPGQGVAPDSPMGIDQDTIAAILGGMAGTGTPRMTDEVWRDAPAPHHYNDPVIGPGAFPRSQRMPEIDPYASGDVLNRPWLRNRGGSV